MAYQLLRHSFTLLFSILSLPIAGMQKNICMHMLDNPEKMDSLVQQARELQELYPAEKYHRICMVGQSMAYVACALKKLNTYQQKKDITVNVAFSGATVHPDDFGSSNFFPSCSLIIKNDQRYKNFGSYVTHIGLDPIDIVDMHKKNQKKTVVVDFFQSGAGLASFIHELIVLGEQKKLEAVDLIQALKVHAIKIDTRYKADHMCIYTNDLQRYTIPLSMHEIVDNDLIFGLGADNIPDDRLVPYYPFSSWQDVNPLNFKPSQEAQRLVKKVEEAVIKNLEK